ncbi:MAG: GntR family transcriptional regulator, partial [Rubricella sp.]
MDGTSPSRIPVAPVHGVKQRHVVEAITEAIVRRRFRPGQRLVEAELTEAMGVSRSVIREALREMA